MIGVTDRQQMASNRIVSVPWVPGISANAQFEGSMLPK